MKPTRLLNPRFVPSQWDLPGGHRFTLAVPPYGTATIRGNRFPRLDRRYGVDSASVRGLNRFNPDEDGASIPVEGTPLLVLPGLRGSDMGLARVLSRLQGREIWVLNPPGMGIASVEPNTEYSLDYLARFASAVAEHMGARPILVGHSFGATWAAAAIQHSPTDFAGLVLISPVVHAPARQRDFLNRVSTRLVDLYCWALRHYLLPHWWVDRYSRGWLSNLIMANFGWPGWIRIRRGSLERQFLHADFHAVAAAQHAATHHDVTEFLTDQSSGAPTPLPPTAVIAGTADPLSPLPQLQELYRDLKNRPRPRPGLPPPLATFITLRGAGHLMHHENYPSVSAALDLAVKKFDDLQKQSAGGTHESA